jgi:hypothetical protein
MQVRCGSRATQRDLCHDPPGNLAPARFDLLAQAPVLGPRSSSSRRQGAKVAMPGDVRKSWQKVHETIRLIAEVRSAPEVGRRSRARYEHFR